MDLRQVILAFLLVGVGHALISIVAPANDTAYFLGEELRVAGSVRFEADCVGSLVLYADSTLVEKRTVNAAAGSIVRLEELFSAPLSLKEGEHLLRISGCREEASAHFKTTSRLGISYSVNFDRLMLNDLLVVNAKAYRRGPLDGLAKIKIGNTVFTEHAEASFRAAAIYSILITAQDEYGNRGEESLFVNVSDQLLLFAAAGRPAYEPGEIAVLNIEIRDAWNRERAAKILLSVNDEVREYNITGFGTVEVLLPYYTAAGLQSAEINANSNGNTAEKTASFFVKGRKAFNYSINTQADTLSVSLQNTGNLRLENISITVCDAGGCMTKTAELEVREEKTASFKTSGKEATVLINDETGTSEESTVSTTGWAVLSPPTLAGLLVAVLLLLAYATWRFASR